MLRWFRTAHLNLQNLPQTNEKHAWNNVGDVTANVVKDDKTGCLNVNNPNYMVIENKSDEEAGIANKGIS